MKPFTKTLFPGIKLRIEREKKMMMALYYPKIILGYNENLEN